MRARLKPSAITTRAQKKAIDELLEQEMKKKYQKAIRRNTGTLCKKKTCLWIKGALPLLKPTNIVTERESTKVAGNWFNKGGKDRQKNRAKTFPGIAKAMAEQWGGDQ